MLELSLPSVRGVAKGCNPSGKESDGSRGEDGDEDGQATKTNLVASFT